ncbi:uncharacterized protein HMPREF1541_11030 [Cyphellophora europaea CBS 101466]|uniref:FAD-binding domain-containing protein n=1 Tax=Cyphellophora europaea (strain CBS 101466) TaxID=1220924 RepID=W2S7M2_CYPE1|nr:uncharacterized protein HMPREF1541_11030 [Cyphellophora europaea CBS 101466]ETN43899.1 hypothetical protein HMPREF1541_11030 [Cyphellophora europaea CBS 101466]
MSSHGYHVLILGGGVAGLTTAMALIKCAPPHLLPKVDIFEIRDEPGTVGGAINLTPNALRLLDYLGVYQIIKDRQYGITVDAVEVFSVYSHQKLAESSFRGPNNQGIGSPPYKAIRITRASLMHALIAALSDHPNITLHLGHRAASITETSTSVTVSFNAHPPHTGDILLGCDGVHSFTRNHHVDPTRRQLYTGVANAFGFAPLSASDRAAAHFETSALNFSRHGLLLTSYHEPTRTSGYVGAILATPDVGSREGWRARSIDRDAVRRDVMGRFGSEAGCVLPSVRTFIEKAADWFLWPVYMVPEGGTGKWATGRTMLLGDAAHAMPPQGESTGIVLEDTVLLARCLLANQLLHDSGSSDSGSSDSGGSTGKDDSVTVIKEAFDAYENLRRGRITAACKESMAVVHSVAATGKWGFWLKTSIAIPIFLRLGQAKRIRHFEEDVTTCALGFGEQMEQNRLVVVPTAGVKGVVSSVLARMGDAWRRGGLWRLLWMLVSGRHHWLR